MEIKREGITFEGYFVPGTRDTRYVQGDPHEFVIEGCKVTDPAAMVAEYGTMTTDEIIEHEYESMLAQAEEEYFSDFDVPDEGEEYDKYEYTGP